MSYDDSKDSAYVKELKAKGVGGQVNAAGQSGCAIVVFLALGAAALIALSSKPSTSGGGAPSPSDYEVLAMQNVRNSLRDPSSADFRNLAITGRIAPGVVCGEVNSKNGFGGYSGFRRFISGGPGLATQIEGEGMDPDEFQIAWDKACI